MKKTIPPVSENPAFMKIFEPELNPGFDPTKTSPNSYEMIYIRDEYGMPQLTSVRVATRRTDPGKGHISRLAADVPGFLDIFDAELNPHIDINILSAADRKTRMTYIDSLGRKHKNVQVYSVIVNLRNRHRGIYGDKQLPENVVGDDPVFWEYCTVTDPDERARIRTVSRKNATMHFPMLCPKGHPFEASPNQMFHTKVPCPYCGFRKIVNGMNDAAKEDPQLLEFWQEPELDLHTLSPKDTGKYHFKCPKCGYKFMRYLNYVIYRHPKCPVCLDTGTPKNLPPDFNAFDHPYDERAFIKRARKESEKPKRLEEYK